MFFVFFAKKFGEFAIYLYFCNTNVNRAKYFWQTRQKPVKICEIEFLDMLIINKL
jgi:hypothetical protein